MAVARGCLSQPAINVMEQQPHIRLTYRETPPRNGKWFRFFGVRIRLLSGRGPWIPAPRYIMRTRDEPAGYTDLFLGKRAPLAQSALGGL
jgi:hypothetical protein